MSLPGPSSGVLIHGASGDPGVGFGLQHVSETIDTWYTGHGCSQSSPEGRPAIVIIVFCGSFAVGRNVTVMIFKSPSSQLEE